MNNILAVFIGGGIGSVLRYGISELVKRNFQFVFPIATLASNILSCLILALAVGMFSDKISSSPSVKLLIVTGICGGFSTFSTFSFETVDLLKQGHAALAFSNILISVSICFFIVYFLTKNTVS